MVYLLAKQDPSEDSVLLQTAWRRMGVISTLLQTNKMKIICVPQML